jgi:dienelactone hydrolase
MFLIFALIIPAADDFEALYRRMREAPARWEALAPKAAVSPRWLEGGRLWYRASRPGGTWEFMLADPAAARQAPAFNHAALAAELSKASGRSLEATKLEIDNLEFDSAGSLAKVRLGNRLWERMGGVWKSAAPGKATGLVPLPRRERSKAGGMESSISFHNSLDQPVQLFWINTEGSEIPYGSIAPGATREQHTFSGHVWMVKAAGKPAAFFRGTESPGRAEIDGSIPEPRRAVASPVDKMPAVFIRDNNLHMRKNDGASAALTTDGTPEDGYRGQVFVAPGGKHAVAMRTRRGQNRSITLVESSPGNQLQQAVKTIPYAKPGDALDQSFPRLFDLAAGKEIPLDHSAWDNPWANDHASWSTDGSTFRFVHNRRGHQVLRFMAIDATTGKSTILIDDKSPTFIDYAHKFHLTVMEAKGTFVWMSERDGWNHLFLHDLKAGKPIRCLTPGPWVVRSVEAVDESAGRILARVMGIHPGQDPYHEHLARVSLEGETTPLTDGDGTHTWNLSPDGRHLVATWSRVDHAPVSELRDATTGRKILELARGSLDALEHAGWRRPERFTAKARDGKTDIWGVIFKPSGFDPGKRYPVLEEIYAGPQGAFVPKGFRPNHRPHAFTELGFIVVKIDGMGTNWRSKAFHDVCHKNLADSGFPDRIIWMREAAKSRAWMDLERVGIFGGSAGGQSALRGLLSHGDFYKAAAADCGCHDNRIDKVWWNELWMGWPVGPHYEAQAAQTDAHKLRGKLLLTVGEVDTNVDPACTLRVVDALVKAGRDFDFLMLPGLGHGAGESPFAAKRRARLFVEALGGPR